MIHALALVLLSAVCLSLDCDAISSHSQGLYFYLRPTPQYFAVPSLHHLEKAEAVAASVKGKAKRFVQSVKCALENGKDYYLVADDLIPLDLQSMNGYTNFDMARSVVDAYSELLDLRPDLHPLGKEALLVDPFTRRLMFSGLSLGSAEEATACGEPTNKHFCALKNLYGLFVDPENGVAGWGLFTTQYPQASTSLDQLKAMLVKMKETLPTNRMVMTYAEAKGLVGRAQDYAKPENTVTLTGEETSDRVTFSFGGVRARKYFVRKNPRSKTLTANLFLVCLAASNCVDLHELEGRQARLATPPQGQTYSVVFKAEYSVTHGWYTSALYLVVKLTPVEPGNAQLAEIEVLVTKNQCVGICAVGNSVLVATSDWRSSDNNSKIADNYIGYRINNKQFVDHAILAELAQGNDDNPCMAFDADFRFISEESESGYISIGTFENQDVLVISHILLPTVPNKIEVTTELPKKYVKVLLMSKVLDIRFVDTTTKRLTNYFDTAVTVTDNGKSIQPKLYRSDGFRNSADSFLVYKIDSEEDAFVQSFMDTTSDGLWLVVKRFPLNAMQFMTKNRYSRDGMYFVINRSQSTIDIILCASEKQLGCRLLEQIKLENEEYPLSVPEEVRKVAFTSLRDIDVYFYFDQDVMVKGFWLSARTMAEQVNKNEFYLDADDLKQKKITLKVNARNRNFFVPGSKFEKMDKVCNGKQHVALAELCRLDII